MPLNATCPSCTFGINKFILTRYGNITLGDGHENTDPKGSCRLEADDGEFPHLTCRLGMFIWGLNSLPLAFHRTPGERLFFLVPHSADGFSLVQDPGITGNPYFKVQTSLLWQFDQLHCVLCPCPPQTAIQDSRQQNLLATVFTMAHLFGSLYVAAVFRNG